MIRASRRRRLVGWAISVVCLAGVALWAVRQPAPHLAGGGEGLLWTAAAVVAFGLVLAGLSERWRFLLRPHVPAISRRTAYRSGALGELGNALLPMRAGDALRIGAVVELEGASIRTTTGAMVVERLLSLGCHAVVLSVTAVSVLGPDVGALGGLARAGLAFAVAGLVALAVGVGVVAASSRLAWSRRLRALAPILVPLARLRRRDALVATLLSAAIWIGEAAAWWAAAQAVGLPLTPIEAAYVIALATLVLIVPAGPGAVGTLDAAIVLALESLGQASGQVIGFVVVLRAATLVPCLAMTVAYGVSGGRRATIDSEKPNESTKTRLRWSSST